jgi:hypothetical protein
MAERGIAQMNAFTWLLQGLHESRRRNAARQIRRYAHLMEASKQRDRPFEVQPAGRKENAWRDADMAAAGARA